MHDLVIRGGTVVDGSGAPRRVADVAVDAGLVVEVGAVDGRGRREIDASGQVVLPGFVDVHTHYDGQATWSQRLDPSSWHGVTTVVMGNCGVGFAPVHDTDHDRLVELMEGVEDIPGTALHEGLGWQWNSFEEYLGELAGRTFDVDVAAQVPHGALRLHVMGERGARREQATVDDMDRMARLAAQGVAAGALGFSTSRTRNHRTSRGEPTPSLDAAAIELVTIAEHIGRTGRGAFQVVSDFDDPTADFDLFARMVGASGRPLSVSIFQDRRNPQRWQQLLRLLGEANRSGAAITGQTAPRPIGVLLGLGCSRHPFMANEVYLGIVGRPAAERVALLQRGPVRERLLEVARSAPRSPLNDFGHIYAVAETPDYEPDPAGTVLARARRAGCEPAEVALDLLLAGDGTGMLYYPFANYSDGNLDATREMLVHPNTVPGLSDGGAHVGTVCDASFPTTLLTHWVRDRPHGRLDLEFVVHRQSRATALMVGLADRGLLAPGHRADLNVVDIDHLQLARPELRHDLPAGGARLVQRASGYRHTFVAGQETYRDGEPTDALPGRLVRGPQQAA